MVDIHDILEADSLSDFRDELVRLGMYEPQLCERLLEWILRSHFYMGGRNPFELLLNDEDSHEFRRMSVSSIHRQHENPWTRRFANLFSFFKRRRGLYSNTDSHNGSYSTYTQRDAHWFVERCQDLRNGTRRAVDSELEKSVAQLYASGAADAIKYLLERADPETLRLFTGRYLDAEYLARQATVRVVVREADDSVTITGNTGRFLIFLQAGRWNELRLSFTNQASMVYYLMYLIHHYWHPECKAPVSLSANRWEFKRLYHCVYQISDEKLEEKVYHLLYREVDGNLRVGRENELRRDIRRHLEDAFSQIGESHQPYAMTAQTHLTVPPELLIFEGGAHKLLDFVFE